MSTGIKVLEIATQHLGERYILGTLAPKNKPSWHGPWDCAEFVSWCVFQAAGILYGCNDNQANPANADAYTGYWARDAQQQGQMISIVQAASTPGAIVLRVPNPEIGHVVISDGEGGTMEAHSTRRGVIKGTLSGRHWDMGILVPGIQYTLNSAVSLSSSPVYHLSSPQMTGNIVKLIQQSLISRGFNPGRVDGIFGSDTAAATRAFQLSEGLLADGEVGSETAEMLGITLS